MKYEEYESAIRAMVENPDTMLASVDGILDNLKTDLEARDALTGEVDELNARVKDLQETNIKLWISKGGEVVEEEEKEPATGKDVINEILEELKEDE